MTVHSMSTREAMNATVAGVVATSIDSTDSAASVVRANQKHHGADTD